MKELTMQIEDDGRFVAVVKHDGAEVASAEGQGATIRCQGKPGAFAEVLQVMGKQIWTQAEEDWSVFHLTGHHPVYWGLVLPNRTKLVGFESHSAALSAVAWLRGMYAALVSPPIGLYVPFLTDGLCWGFLDRAGQLHSGMDTRAMAEGCALKENAGGAV